MRAVLGRAATPQAVQQAITRLSDCVSVLRPPHGALARFHGCDGGAPALLSQIQDRADEGRKPAALPRFSRAAGYIRLSCATSCLILDASPPPPQTGRESGPCKHECNGIQRQSLGLYHLLRDRGGVRARLDARGPRHTKPPHRLSRGSLLCGIGWCNLDWGCDKGRSKLKTHPRRRAHCGFS